MPRLCCVLCLEVPWWLRVTCSRPSLPHAMGMLTAWKALCGRLDNFFLHLLVLTCFTAEFLRPGFLCEIKMSMVETIHECERGGVGVWVQVDAPAA